MRLPKKIAAVLTVSLINGCVVTSNIYADDDTKIDILQGKERYETAIQISDKGWSTGAKEAIIVSDTSIVDAISATPFASLKNAPILLTQKDTLNEQTKAQLKKLGVNKVYIIGGENVVSKKVEEQLKGEKLQIDRIQGKSRENTAVEIAKRIHEISPISEIAVVNGYKGLADAVSIASVSGTKKMPILLASSQNSAEEVYDFIKDKDIKASYIVGGDSVISDDIKSKLPNVKSFEGIDRKDTNAKVIENFYTQNDINNIYISKDGIKNQDQLIDALAVGVLAAKNNSPVLLVSDSLGNSQKNLIDTKYFDTLTQVGGNGNETSFNEIKEIQDVDIFNVSTVSQLEEAIEKANANDIINMASSKGLLKGEKAITEDINISTNKKININLSGNYDGKVVVNTPNAKIVNKGNIKNIVVQSNADANSVEILNQGTIDSLKINDNAKGKIENINSATINNLEIAKNASNVEINNKGKIDKLDNNSSNTNISNSGSISNSGNTGNSGSDTSNDSKPIEKVTPVVTDVKATNKKIKHGDKLSEIELTGTVKDGNKNVEGKLTFEKPNTVLKAGTTEVNWIFTPENQEFYNSVQGKITLTIEKITPVVTDVEVANKKVTYGDEIKLTGTVKDGDNNVEGTFTFKDQNTVLNAGIIQVNWTFIPKDEEAYNRVNGEINLNIEKAEPIIEGNVEVITDVAAGETVTQLKGIEVKGVDGNTLSGTWIGIAPATKETTEEVEFTFTPDDISNYTSETITVSVTTLPVVVKGEPTLSETTITYGQKVGDIGLSGNTMTYDDNTVNGKFEFKNPDLVPNAGIRNVEWVFTPDEKTYKTIVGSSQIEVEKIDTKAVKSMSQDEEVKEIKLNELKDLRVVDEEGNIVNGRWSGLRPEVGEKKEYTFIPSNSNYDYTRITVTGVERLELPELTNEANERIDPNEGSNNRGVADSIYEILKKCNWEYDDEKRIAYTDSENIKLEDKQGKDGIDGIVTLHATSSQKNDMEAIKLLGLMLGKESNTKYERLIELIANGSSTIDDGTRKIEITWDGNLWYTIKITFYNYGTESQM